MNTVYKNLDYLDHKIEKANKFGNKYGLALLHDIKGKMINFTKFLLKDSNTIKIATGFIIASQTNNLAKLLIDNIVAPIIYKIIQLYTNKPVETLEKYKYEYLGINFELGQLIINILKFIIIMMLLYYITTLTTKDELDKIINNIKNLIP